MRKKILIADNDPSIMLGIRFIFEDEGYELIKADNGEDALKITREKIPDLIVLDIMMPPGGDNEGLRVLEEIRKDSNDNITNIPIIMLTAKPFDNDRRKAEKLGICKYMKKPFDSDEFLEIVKEYI